MVITLEPDFDERVKSAQNSDEKLIKLKTCTLERKIKAEDKIDEFKATLKHLKIINGIIFKVRNKVELLVVPDTYKIKIL